MMQAQTTQTEVMQIDPAAILAEGNSRFGLKKLRIERLAQDILDVGGVQTPVEVEELSEPDEAGHSYRLISGFYRHAAVAKLNAEAEAGLFLPALVRVVGDDTARLRAQIRENLERESLSPMDEAVTIKHLLDVGVSRAEVAKTFARPGGRKGLTMQSASNAFLNMTMSFLELPKAIQERIHDGRVGVAAAYELTKLPPDQRQAVLDRAEQDRQHQMDREEREETKFQEAEEKAQTAATKVEEVRSLLGQTELELKQAAALAKQRKEAVKMARATCKSAQDDEEKDEAQEHLKAAETDLKGAEKLVETKQKALAKLKEKAEKVEETAEAAAKNLESVKAGKKPKAIGAADVKAAAQKEGAEGASTVLSAKDMRAIVADLALDGVYPKVKEIGEAFQKCFVGVLSDTQLYNRLATITGEREPGKKAKAKKKEEEEAA